MAIIDGDNDNNTLNGTGDPDVINGFDGNDILIGEGGADELNGGDGFDFASYSTSTVGITASLADPSINTGDAAGDTYDSIEGLIGSDFDDVLVGAAGADALRGGDGGDELYGGAGNDFADYRDATAAITVNLADPSSNTGVAIGDTYDSIEGIIGGDFDDTLIGNGGINFLRGGEGADILIGGGSTDFADYRGSPTGVIASLADPSINTGHAAGDTYIAINGLMGSDHDDTLIGDGANNILIGGAGADELIGGANHDWAGYQTSTVGITVSLANPSINTGHAIGDSYDSIEALIGSSFDDTLIGDSASNSLRGGLGADILNGGGGGDVADYAASSIGLTVSLASPGANTGEAAGDTFISIEGLGGSNFNDTLIGDGGNNWLTGNGGADTLIGGGGKDFAVYNANPFLTSGIVANLTNPGLNTGEAAGDTYTSIEGLVGTFLNDTLTGNGGANELRGELGNDRLYGEGGGDTLYGFRGNDKLYGGASNDKLYGENDKDQLYGEAGADNLNGGKGNDKLYGGAGNDKLYGENDKDQLYGDAGSDRLYGGKHNDKLFGGAGKDFAYFTGKASAYKIVTKGAKTTVTGKDGKDILTGVEVLVFSDGNVLI